MAEATPKSTASKKPAAPVKAGTQAKPGKAAPTKPVAKFPAKPAVAEKAPVAKKIAPKPRAEKKTISAEQRYLMIAEAAYFRAERCHFKGDPVRDWIEAERDIALLLGERK